MRSTGPTATRNPLPRPPALLSPVGMPEYVLVLREEWDRVMMRDMVQEGIRALEDPNTEWIDADEVTASFAAPNIAAERKKRGWTQKQLGEKLKMPQSQVARMEKTPGSITYKTLQRVAKALGVTTGDLLK